MTKKVIFICLLSLTTCLSRPDGTPEKAASSTPSPTAAVTTKKADAPGVTTAAPTGAPPAPTNSPAALPTTPSVNNTGASAVPTNDTKPTTPNPVHPAEDNNTTNKTTPSTDKPNETPAIDPNNHATDADKKTTTTLAPPPAHDDKKNNTSTSTKPEVTTKANEPAKPVAVAGRGFDGPSFIGGIILTLGLLAVGFMGFKYYRNQTERNYHTL